MILCGGLEPLARTARSDTVTRDEIDAGWYLEGCGREIDIPAHREDRLTWDVRTEVVEGIEFVVERSLCIECPHCGYAGRFNEVHELVEPKVPLRDHEPAMNWARAVADQP